jgi:DUF1365 family protein
VTDLAQRPGLAAEAPDAVGPADRAAPPRLPALVRGRVRHTRLHPIRHAFSYRAHQWLVDADHPRLAPRGLGLLASIDARDHIGRGDAAVGDNVRRFLAAHGVAWTAHRIVMLANARSLGYVFDPLTVYWCHAADGTLEGVVAEVHNTYGERHAYVVEIDDEGRGKAAKEFYVSPFFGVFGEYALRFVLRGDKVGAFVTLRQGGRVVFTGSFVGRPEPATAGAVVRSALTQPMMPLRVSALIRLHGVRLWRRSLPVVRRRPHREQEGTR